MALAVHEVTLQLHTARGWFLFGYPGTPAVERSRSRLDPAAGALWLDGKGLLVPAREGRLSAIVLCGGPPAPPVETLQQGSCELDLGLTEGFFSIESVDDGWPWHLLGLNHFGTLHMTWATVGHHGFPELVWIHLRD